MNVLVLGGKGFIGRHVAAALRANGLTVCVSSRHAPAVGSPGEVCIRMERMKTPEHWRDAFHNRRIDIVVNCIGILRPRWLETYDAVHHRGVRSLAHACAALGVHLVHVSAHGLKPDALSGFNRSKWAGERAIEASGALATIVRVPLLDGDDGYGARWFRRVAGWPVHLIPSNARGLLAPMHVDALAARVAVICANGIQEKTGADTVECGGARCVSLAEHLEALRAPTLPPARQIAVPAWMAWTAAALCDVFHLTPFSIGHAELLTAHNAPSAMICASDYPSMARSPQSVASSFPHEAIPR